MNVFQKALLLVCVPLLIQLTGVFCLLRIVQDSSTLIDREARSRKTITLIDEVISSSTRCLIESVGFLIFNDENAKPRRMAVQAKLRADVKELDAITRTDPVEHSLVKRVKATIASLLIRESYALHVPREISTSIVAQKNKVYTLHFSSVFDRYTQLVTLQELEVNKVKQLTTATEKLRHRFQWTLSLSSLLSMGSLLLLTMLFWRDLRPRIEHVRTNALHLLSRTAPEQPVRSRDEICELDTAIYNAALEIETNELARRNLVSVVTHELRSPLTSLRGTLELMGADAFGAVPDAVKQRLQKSVLILEPALELINHFLALESIKAGKVVVQKIQCAPADVFELCVEDIPAEAYPRLVFEGSEASDANFHMDQSLVARVVASLLKLVMKQATPPDIVRVRCVKSPDQALLSIIASYAGTNLSEVVDLSSCELDKEIPDDEKVVPAYLTLLLCSSLMKLHGGGLRLSTAENGRNEVSLEMNLDDESIAVNPDEPTLADDLSPVTSGTSRPLHLKLAALVLAPLAFMLIVPAIISTMLSEVQHDLTQEHRAWSIYSDIAAIKNNTATSSIAAVLNNFNPDKWLVERWKSDSQKTRDAVDHLISLRPGLGDGAAEFDKFRSSVLRVNALYARLLALPQGTIVENFWKAPLLKELHSENLLNEKLTAAVMSISGEQRELLARKSERTRSFLMTVLGSSIVIGILLCASLATFVSLFMTTRLASLVQTTKCLSARMSLPPALNGSDEFCRIDGVLHEADRRLRDFESFKKRVAIVMMGQLSPPLIRLRDGIEEIENQFSSDLSERARVRIRRAVLDCERLMRLLEDLRSVQIMVGGKFEINPIITGTDEIITASMACLETTARKAGIEIRPPSRSVDIYADPDRIIQVIINLLSNAIKFSPRGSVVGVEVEPGDNCAIISISDKGRGMSKDFQSRLFSAFEQMEIADSSIKRGSGLGLYLCKKLVEQHGGCISVSSEENKGTTFSIKLPTVTKSTVGQIA